MRLISKWLIYTLAITVAAYFLPGVVVSGLGTALIAAAALGLINTLIRPLLILLTLPITVLTLGLFVLIINALLVILASKLVPGFYVAGFWSAMLFSLVVSGVNWMLGGLVRDK